MNSKSESSTTLVLLGTGLIVAGGVLLGLAHLHVIGWILVGVGIFLLALAALSLVLGWLRHRPSRDSGASLVAPPRRVRLAHGSPLESGRLAGEPDQVAGLSGVTPSRR